MFVEKHLEESNDIPRLLSKEIKEIYMAELCTLDESIEELKENLKRKFQVGRVIAEYMEVIVYLTNGRLSLKTMFLIFHHRAQMREKSNRNLGKI